MRSLILRHHQTVLFSSKFTYLPTLLSLSHLWYTPSLHQNAFLHIWSPNNTGCMERQLQPANERLSLDHFHEVLMPALKPTLASWTGLVTSIVNSPNCWLSLATPLTLFLLPLPAHPPPLSLRLPPPLTIPSPAPAVLTYQMDHPAPRLPPATLFMNNSASGMENLLLPRALPY